MNRRKFSERCLVCLPASLGIPLLTRCQSTWYTLGAMEPNGLSVSVSEFKYIKNDRERIRPYIIVRNELLEFPIYLFRFGEHSYSALLMKCTHQGNELQASGDHLACPAHGSEFTNRGEVVEGPAEYALRSFKVVEDGDKIFIDLRV